MSIRRRSAGSEPTPLQQMMRTRRLELKLTQADVARALGIFSPDFVSLVEQGTRKLDLDRIPRLADVLQLNAQDLCRMALNESHPSLYRALFESAAPTVREDTHKRFSIEPDVVRKLQELDAGLHKPITHLIEGLYRKQEQRPASANLCSCDAGSFSPAGQQGPSAAGSRPRQRRRVKECPSPPSSSPSEAGQ